MRNGEPGRRKINRASGALNALALGPLLAGAVAGQEPATPEHAAKKLEPVAHATGTLEVQSAKETVESIAYDEHEREVKCLAKNIFEEAGAEPDAGKEAVGLVTLFRSLSKKYPDTVCGVVYQRLQFSWTLDKNKVTRDIPLEAQPHVHEIAERLYALRADPEQLKKKAA